MIVQNKGIVYLVGAGPGDYRLLTERGKNILENADIVIYDRLVNPSLLAFAPSADKVYVGKSRDKHRYTQTEINELLEKEAKKGKKVIRLKGGDPFVFGRGGEEALYLKENNIKFEVIPGITSVIGALSYAGIPVTDRNFSSSFHVFSGHDPGQLDFENISRLTGTIIFVMGLKNIEVITKKLIKNGYDQKTSAAVIYYGTTSQQKVITGEISSIATKVKKYNLKPPVIIVTGNVVNLHKKIDWFGHNILSGKRILITRPYGQFEELGQRLESLGGEVLYYPAIKIKGPVINQEIKNVIRKINQYNWIIFTSANGVKYFFTILNKLKMDIRKIANTKFAVIGSATGEELSKYGINYDFMPDKYTTISLGRQFIKRISSNNNENIKILLARSDIADQKIEENLENNFEVKNITIYRTVIPNNRWDLSTHLKERNLDLLTFTSSSTVEYFEQMISKISSKVKKTPSACIGPVTAETAERLGFKVEIIAQKHDENGLIEAIKEFYSKKNYQQ